MQYKIPVQIENEDPIFLGLSLKKLIILMVGGGISYSIFKNLSQSIGPEIAALPALILFLFTLVIVFLKVSEMTFVPYVLSAIRQYINSEPKIWVKGIDSFQAIDLGYITKETEKVQAKVDTSKKTDKIKELNEKIKSI